MAVVACLLGARSGRAFEDTQEASLFAGVATAPIAQPGEAGLFRDLPLAATRRGPSAGRRRSWSGSRLPVAAFPVPRRLRPCCAFGQGLSVSLLGVPVPGVRIDNLVDPDRLGRHRYDASVLGWSNGIQRAFVSSEVNGLVYTRRGGFVDVAHVRQFADWTVYLAQEIGRLLPDGGDIVLPEEGGRRIVHVEPVSPGWLRTAGRDEVAIALAQWLAWQLSVWHELATLHGWSSLPVFPERVSAFSPEDLYSNAIGIGIAGAILRAGGADTPTRWERNADVALVEVLRRLEAVDRREARRAAAYVDGFWWDSSRRLPAPSLVLQRNPHLGPTLVPWRVALPGGRDRKGAGPALLEIVQEIAGRPVRALARLEVQPAGPVARSLDCRSVCRPMTQSDFAALAAH